jgi:outer membrane protein
MMSTATGEMPEHDHTLCDNYAAAGVNISVPIFNDGVYRARRDEAALQVEAGTKIWKVLRVQVAQEVRNAWFEANDAPPTPFVLKIHTFPCKQFRQVNGETRF